ncbi:hypothetical protein LTR97_004216 [Elasticomyces elasticus]|uniref:F-box domain-containing protein n=1 Tax=Elasticomyces elasticus TaxID=574655 RepID=A0AAN7VTY4_9PEZI|nr:hypothetical protein LTR97_004216 [Elasticomyces elasticus]
MADNDQHFRLLDLPPELRVRIYECFFELPTSLEATSIFEAQQQAPSLAIAVTSRLIRHEALDLGRIAVRHFFEQQSFFLQMPVYTAEGRDSETDAFEAAAVALPRFPISTMEFRFTVLDDPRDSPTSDHWKRHCRKTVRTMEGGQIEEVSRWRLHGIGQDYRTQTDSLSIKGAAALSIMLTNGASLQYLDVGNVSRALLWCFHGE